MTKIHAWNVEIFRFVRPNLLPAILWAFIASCPVTADAQSWKDALEAEQAQNARRLAAINAQAEPLAAKLRANTAAIQTHNQQYPTGTCTYPAGHPEVCTPWIQEASRLNTEKQNLLSILVPLKDESDGLIARNAQLAQRLRCVPLPVACKSNADCNECSSCGNFDGTRGSGTCQPRP